MENWRFLPLLILQSYELSAHERILEMRISSDILTFDLFSNA